MTCWLTSIYPAKEYHHYWTPTHPQQISLEPFLNPIVEGCQRGLPWTCWQMWIFRWTLAAPTSVAWEPLKTHSITLLTIHWSLKAVAQRQIDRDTNGRQIERGRASYPSWWRILRVATYSDPLVGDGGFDDEDVVDQVELLPQGDLQHVHLHNERGEGARMKKNRQPRIQKVSWARSFFLL